MKKQKRPSVFGNFLFLLAAVACLAYYFANGLLIRFGQSLLWIWLVFALLLLARFILVGRTIVTGKPSPLPRWLLNGGHALVAAGLVVLLIVEGIILRAGLVSPVPNLDYIVVLGAKVNGTTPSGALRNRIQVASEYLRDNPETLCIASGGQGSDEGISEAQCIFDGLTARGIAPERILREDASTSTIENLRYSLSLIENPDSAEIGVVTNNFHIYRAMKIAASQPVGSFHPVPVSTSLFSFPHYMLREFAAVAVGTITGKW